MLCSRTISSTVEGLFALLTKHIAICGLDVKESVVDGERPRLGKLPEVGAPDGRQRQARLQLPGICQRHTRCQAFFL